MSTVTSADGTTIDYARYGAGPAVIFIGGATQYRAIDPVTTKTTQELAAEGFTTIDYDRRGRCGSTDTAPYALAREVEDIAALIEAVGGTATLYTSSSGAAIALAAVTAGLGVDRLALYEPPFFAGLDNTAHVEHLRALVAEGRRDDVMRYNMTKVLGVPDEVVEGMAQSPGLGRFRRGRADRPLRHRQQQRSQPRPGLEGALGRGHRADGGLLRRPDLPRHAGGR